MSKPSLLVLVAAAGLLTAGGCTDGSSGADVTSAVEADVVNTDEVDVVTTDDVQNFLRGSVELLKGSVDYEVPREVRVGEFLDFLFCLSQPDIFELFATFGADPSGPEATHAGPMTPDNEGCVSGSLEVNHPAGTTQILWTSDGTRAVEVAEVNVTD